MDKDQFNKAKELCRQRTLINVELKIWEDELTSKSKLGYLQGWNNNHPSDLKTNISKGMFEGFRCAAMDNLKLKLVAIEKQFEAL